MEGWVYVLSHRAWSKLGGTGAVKIGKTSIDPAKRGLQIASASGLLNRPTVEFCCWVADKDAVETAVHQHLARYRVDRRRELFAVPVATARAVIEGATMVRPVTLRRRYGRHRYKGSNGRRQLLGVLILSAALIAARWFL